MDHVTNKEVYMSYDGVVLRAVSLELHQALAGARIDKIYQPVKNEIHFVVRQTGRTHRLLLGVSAEEAGVYLTGQSRPNPQSPPLFCMVLRKHLEGGRILSVAQMDMERLLEITAEVLDDFGDLAKRTLIVEIMGKHSNIILLDADRKRIIDSLRRVTPAVSRYRQVLPGLEYMTPPPQDKITPWDIEEEGFYEKILGYPLTQNLQKALLNSFAGLGPQTVTEIIYRAGLEPGLSIEYCGQYELSKLWQAFHKAAEAVRKGEFSPEVIGNEKGALTFSALALTHYPPEQRQTFASMNEALDHYYQSRKSRSNQQQKKAALLAVIKKEIDRCEKKAGLQSQTIEESRNSEKYRVWGDLLLANSYHLQPAPEVVAANFYEPDNAPETIPLDENLTIPENAQRYFNRYQKNKHAAQQARLQLAETQTELEYLYSLANSLDNVTVPSELEEIHEELRETGYLKDNRKPLKNKPGLPMCSQPQKILCLNWEIYWGKNNKQNDLLTMKIARPEDTWLHTKDIPGSHVVIKNPGAKQIPAEVLETAALLSAYFSQARRSTHVPVDYTLKKHVWKLKGAKPGMVHYENQRTIYVTPDEEKTNGILAASH